MEVKPSLLPARSPSEPTEARTRAIKRRLLHRVAEAETSHVSIGAGEGGWQPWLPGVSIKVLYERDGLLSYLLRLQAGATLPPHRHPVDEECVVLEGSVRIGANQPLGAGGYHLAHKGTLHTAIGSPGGAIIFLRGAVPQADQEL